MGSMLWLRAVCIHYYFFAGRFEVCYFGMLLEHERIPNIILIIKFVFLVYMKL